LPTSGSRLAAGTDSAAQHRTDVVHLDLPAFWFGHGLGYSTWDYSPAELVADAPSPTVAVTVTNTGTRVSREVVQVYFQPAEADQPIRLVGWQPLRATPGQSVPMQVSTRCAAVAPMAHRQRRMD
jgi:hypothetical protein